MIWGLLQLIVLGLGKIIDSQALPNGQTLCRIIISCCSGGGISTSSSTPATSIVSRARTPRIWIHTRISHHHNHHNQTTPPPKTPKMVKPLTFKGDKPKKRKHRDPPDPDSASKPKAAKPSTDTPTESGDGDADADDQTWVSADTSSDIAGPVLLVLPSEKPTCLASDANGKVFASELENLVEGDPASAEPHDVRQVWVATRVAGTESFSFKGHHGRYAPSLPL